jgi:hypothetical protein
MKRMDEQKLRKIYDALFEERAQSGMRILHRVWFRNVLYYLGEQWFEWVRGQETFRRIMPNPYTPTPVSNIIRDYVRSMKSLVLNKDYAVTIWPNSNDQEDRDAAEMGETFLRWLETYNDEQHLDEREKIAIWMVLVGTAFDRTTISRDDDGWVMDKSGNPITTGNVVSASVNPFSVCVDSYGETLRQKRWIGIKTLRPREWVEDTFKLKIAAGEDRRLIDYERKLSQLVANVSPWKGDGVEWFNEFTDEDMVLFKEVECRPTKEFPRGHYSAMVGDQIVFEYDRLPIAVGKDGRWDYSLTDFHYHYVPGRFWSDPGVNDLISPQNTVNEIDQELAINRKGIGKPLVLVPTDVNMKRLTRFGQSVLVLQYDALLSGGAKPEIGRGIPLPGQVLDERAVHMQSAQDAAGDPRNVLRGKAPTQQASGVMVDILRDAAEQGHLPDVERFFRALKRVKRKQLLLAQEAYTEERLIKIPDRGGRAKVIKFRGADLRNNTDVRIELASGAASTRAGQANLLLKLVGEGFFNADSPIDPEFRLEILKRVGLGGFQDKASADMLRAQAENDLCVNYREDESLKKAGYEEIDPETGAPVRVEIDVVEGLFAGMWIPGAEEPVVIEDDPMFEFDNHEVHYEVHRRFIVSPEFKALPGPVRDAMIVHAKSHKEALRAKAEAEQNEMMQKAAEFEAQAAAAKAQGPPLAGGPGAPPELPPEFLPGGGAAYQEIPEEVYTR